MLYSSYHYHCFNFQISAGHEFEMIYEMPQSLGGPTGLVALFFFQTETLKLLAMNLRSLYLLKKLTFGFPDSASLALAVVLNFTILQYMFATVLNVLTCC